MKKLLISALLFSTMLSACSGDVKSSLGMRKEAPDEYVVISYPPLKTPPNIDDLRQNGDGKANFYYQSSVRNKMHHHTEGHLSNSDQEFLNQLGSSSHEHSSEVRKTLVEEHKQTNKKNASQGVVGKTISKVRGDQEDPVIDPIAERERIKNNQEQGAPINQGEVLNKKSSTIDRIFSGN